VKVLALGQVLYLWRWWNKLFRKGDR